MSAGFSANLLLTSIDPLLASFTAPAAQLIDKDYSVPVAANWYPMVALTPVFIVVGSYITESIVEPYLGEYDSPEDFSPDEIEDSGLTGTDRYGLRWARGAALVTLVGGVLVAVPEGAPFFRIRDSDREHRRFTGLSFLPTRASVRHRSG